MFESGPFSGNPLAVVHASEDLDTDQMQQITRWLNLSETVFLMPAVTAGADYQVRIFTLARELPFAGHPTLGACHAWLGQGGQPQAPDRIVQGCAVGLVELRQAHGRLAFAAPPLLRSGAVEVGYAKQVLDVLGVERSSVADLAWVDNGPGWVGVLFDSADEVLALEPDFSKFEGTGSLDIGVIGPRTSGADTAFEVRAFFSDARGAMVEDPVTGSLNASLAQWLTSTGRAPTSYSVRQGTRLGRTGTVFIDLDTDGTVWVGGRTSTTIDGTIEI